MKREKRRAVAAVAAAAIGLTALGAGGCGTRLEGASLDRYTVVYAAGDGTAERLAREFCSAAQREHGMRPRCTSDASADAGREILFGKTNRMQGEGTPEGRFTVSAVGDSILLESDTPSGLYAAGRAVLSHLSEGRAEYSSPFTGEYEDLSIRVMSFNLRTVDVSPRIDRVKSVIARNDPDLLGVQEASSAWQTALVLDGYSRVGIGRDGASDEACFIFYRTDKFELSEEGTRWYTETPEVPSVLSGSSYRRIYTYAVLRRKTDGVRFLYVNTHMHLHMASRKTAAGLLLSFLNERYPDLPVYLTGDFNTDIDREGDVYRYYAPGEHEDFDTLLEEDGFENARLTATRTDDGATFPSDLYADDNKGGAPSSCYNKGVGDIIDYCMTREAEDAGVFAHTYFADRREPDVSKPAAGLGNAASDHYPIVADTLLFGH